MLAPIPGQIAGESSGETLEPERVVGNLGEWFAGLLAHSPAAYSTIDRYVREIFPDFLDIKNPIVGGERRSLACSFAERTRCCRSPSPTSRTAKSAS